MTAQYDTQRLAYLWYSQYIQWDEFNYEPEWCDTMQFSSIDREDDTTTYLLKDPTVSKDAWITADRTVPLTKAQ